MIDTDFVSFSLVFFLSRLHDFLEVWLLWWMSADAANQCSSFFLSFRNQLLICHPSSQEKPHKHTIRFVRNRLLVLLFEASKKCVLLFDFLLMLLLSTRFWNRKKKRGTQPKLRWWTDARNDLCVWKQKKYNRRSLLSYSFLRFRTSSIRSSRPSFLTSRHLPTLGSISRRPRGNTSRNTRRGCRWRKRGDAKRN